jgi:hypothetical protein
MAVDEQQDRAQRSILHLQSALLQAIAADQVIMPRHHAQVHAAIDLLRAAHADRALLQRAEAISCMLHMMALFLRQGRINAYASARLRLRTAASGLGACGLGAAGSW